MLKYLGVSLLGLFVLLVFPLNTDVDVSNADQPKFYGAATVIAADVMGNEFFKQTVHNTLLDRGEHILIGNTFSNGTNALADTTAIGAICVSDNEPTINEAMTAATFDAVIGTSSSGFSGGDGNCISDNGNVVTTGGGSTAGGVATIGGLTFVCSASSTSNCNADSLISSIAICESNGGTTNYTGCSAQGEIFAFVDISNVTLASDETVTITYVFDISSSGS